MSEVSDIVNRCISHGDEAEWFEFKENLNKPDDIGEYIAALSNAAVMAHEPFGYLIWGIHNTTHEFTDTKFNYNRDINNEPFQHNLWTSGSAPKFHAYKDRIEITSLGTLPPNQTKDGFFAGISVPVNDKLSEIFLQLHISEMSGRGVPRIVDIYGKEAFDFRDNAIVVSIPFDRLDLGSDDQDVTQDVTQDNTIETINENSGSYIRNQIEKQILDYCKTARSTREIVDYLGVKERKTASKYIRSLLEKGKLAMTLPEKPNSRYQKYISIK